MRGPRRRGPHGRPLVATCSTRVEKTCDADRDRRPGARSSSRARSRELTGRRLHRARRHRRRRNARHALLSGFGRRAQSPGGASRPQRGRVHHRIHQPPPRRGGSRRPSPGSPSGVSLERRFLDITSPFWRLQHDRPSPLRSRFPRPAASSPPSCSSCARKRGASSSTTLVLTVPLDGPSSTGSWRRSMPPTPVKHGPGGAASPNLGWGLLLLGFARRPLAATLVGNRGGAPATLGAGVLQGARRHRPARARALFTARIPGGARVPAPDRRRRVCALAAGSRGVVLAGSLPAPSIGPARVERRLADAGDLLLVRAGARPLLARRLALDHDRRPRRRAARDCAAADGFCRSSAPGPRRGSGRRAWAGSHRTPSRDHAVTGGVPPIVGRCGGGSPSCSRLAVALGLGAWRTATRDA